MHAKVVIGPRVRKSPFFDDTIAAGADQFTIYNHMYMPSGFGDPLGDYWQLINSVAMWDVSCERQVQLSGPDADQLADYLSTRDLLNCEIGIGKYAPLTNYQGYLINDPVAQRIEEDVYWLSIADNDSFLPRRLLLRNVVCTFKSASRMCPRWPFRGQNHPMSQRLCSAIGYGICGIFIFAPVKSKAFR
jgi:hypothetical protein